MTQLSTEIFKESETDQGLRQTTLRLRPSQLSKIEKLSEQSGVSIAEAARRVIDLGLEGGVHE